MSGIKKIVTRLRFAVCCIFKVSIATRRNFSEKWLLGAESVHTSNIRDHAKADHHTHAMSLLKKKHARRSGSNPTSYAPIAMALYRISDAEKDQLRHKFDIVYFMAIENISFLNARHGVAIDYSVFHFCS